MRHRETESKTIERAGGRGGGTKGQTCPLLLRIVYAARPPVSIAPAVRGPFAAVLLVVLGRLPRTHPALRASVRNPIPTGRISSWRVIRATVPAILRPIICKVRASIYEARRILAWFCSNGFDVSISRYIARSVHLRKIRERFGCMPGGQVPAITLAHPAYVPWRSHGGRAGGWAEM